MIIQLVVLTIVSLIPLGITNVYADHVDNIWIETAKGNFVLETEQTSNLIDKITTEHPFEDRKFYGAACNARSTYYTQTYHAGDKERPAGIIDRQHPRGWIYPETERINEITVINQVNGCGINEEKYLKSIISEENINERHGTELTFIEIEEPKYKEHHECICGYWYSNTVKDEYTYTVLDMPRDRELPPNYTEKILTGIKAGFDRWGDLNDIDFRYTDSRLEANIIIQPQIGDGKQYGNAVIGCLFDNNQCTIQLFPDANVGNQQTLVNSLSIEWTVAHEFGHLIGLPHHIDPNNIMNTIHAKDVRTYYEVGGINVPDMVEPTYEQRLLENENNNTYTTGNVNIDEIMNHETTKKFIEYIEQTLQKMPEADRYQVWYDILLAIFYEMENTIFGYN